MIAHRWERNPKDVGDQALMRGFGTAVPRYTLRGMLLSINLGFCRNHR
jgi:hypothetical protein